ncbi:MAG: hypothetical protein O7E57_11290 [Gammaproteobacteria bacterium]|nr:hypothetical protein [Gammaproteobacteria bacterium]
MTYKKYLTALTAYLIAINLQAQVSAPTGNEPRNPKGVPGLEEGQAGALNRNWLLNATDDQERFRRIQIYAGGTYEQMWQVGYRYQQVYQAIIDENWELGLHHWVKLRDVFNVALMKRPRRTPNAEAMFLDNAWKQLEEALQGGDAEDIQEVFLRERGTCMACHIAEQVEFLNDTPSFRDTANFPPE